MDLGLEDFKQLLFDLYLAQRENAELRAALHKMNGDEPDDDNGAGVRDP